MEEVGARVMRRKAVLAGAEAQAVGGSTPPVAVGAWTVVAESEAASTGAPEAEVAKEFPRKTAPEGPRSEVSVAERPAEASWSKEAAGRGPRQVTGWRQTAATAARRVAHRVAHREVAHREVVFLEAGYRRSEGGLVGAGAERPWAAGATGWMKLPAAVEVEATGVPLRTAKVEWLNEGSPWMGRTRVEHPRLAEPRAAGLATELAMPEVAVWSRRTAAAAETPPHRPPGAEAGGVIPVGPGQAGHRGPRGLGRRRARAAAPGWKRTRRRAEAESRRELAEAVARLLVHERREREERAEVGWAGGLLEGARGVVGAPSQRARGRRTVPRDVAPLAARAGDEGGGATRRCRAQTSAHALLSVHVRPPGGGGGREAIGSAPNPAAGMLARLDDWAAP